MKTRTLLALATLVGAALPGAATTQDLNLPIAVDSVEFLLTSAPFEIAGLTGTRFQEDRTDRAELIFDENTVLLTKLAPAARGGQADNNVPQYEVAPYELQRLFLADDEIVVPPTVMRAFPLDWYRTLDEDVDATFRDVNSVVVVLQAFVSFVTDENVWDEDRFEADPAYAKNWANANLLTYLIRHNDSNTGNLLISTMAANPRVFAVDNGYAFNSQDSDRGTRWRNLLVRRFPAATVQRLRAVTEDQLHDLLGVLAQWRVQDGELVPAEPGENIDSRRGVRVRNGVVQFGLTRDEIEDVWYRLETFLGEVDGGRLTTF